MSDTIAAISTAQGEGGISVIRISGDSAFTVCDKIFKGINNKKLADMKGYTASFGKIVSDGEEIDEAVALVFREPLSYTGENVVELSCHGGIYITKLVLRAVLDAGAVPARAALCVKEGAVRNKIDEVKNLLLSTAAHLSAWADYPEEDIAEVTDEQLYDSFDVSIAILDGLISSYDSGQAVKQGIDTVIAGRPNVGKSTLMNLLSGCERSIVTDIPGTTRDIIEDTVIVGDVILRLSDTAGLRTTDDKVEKIGVDRAKHRLKQCGLLLAVFDYNRSLDDDDKELIQSAGEVPCIAIINKTDLEKQLDTEYIESKIKNVVYLSAKSGDGRAELVKAVEDIAGIDNFNPSEGVLSNERQRQAVLNSLNSVKDAKNALEIGLTYDAITVSIEEAITSLLELTGERTSDEVVDRVFHNFCVGK